MASRSAGTLLTGNNATYVPPSLMPGYQGHVPNLAASFGETYGNATFKYFQDCRNSASCSSHNKGGQFPTLFARNPNLGLGYRSRVTPTYARYNLDCNRSEELKQFYQLVQMHREHYRDKTGTVNRVPYFVLPVKEKNHYPLPTDLPPLSPRKKWHLFRMAPENLKTHQTYSSGERVSRKDRYVRDSYFEYRA